tara:strand:- start:4379 stop:5557 length:1179 start_codon:yes stop_codon:yes gene_type:complete
MKCKVCQNNSLKEIIDLGKQPLANKYPLSKNIKNEKIYHLLLLLCKKCLAVRIKKIISRNEMFEDYYYLSSVNNQLVLHFEKLAKKLNKSNFVLDIGSNDGILLRPLKKLGVKCLGIDPSINVGKIANKDNLETLIGFFDNKNTEKILKNYGKPDVIVASSIFTHVSEPKKFIKNIKKLLSENGMFILEIEYLNNFVKNLQFERFYFDRPFYYSIKSINKLTQNFDMHIEKIEFIQPHGGSVRCYIKNKKNNINKKIKNIIKIEEKNLSIKNFKLFEKKIIYHSLKFKKALERFKNNNLIVGGYGAPARLSTITNFSNINKTLIKFIIDDSKLKQGRFSPGVHIPIKKFNYLSKKKCDILIVFAYDYFIDIKKKLQNYKFKFYKPFPFIKLK